MVVSIMLCSRCLENPTAADCSTDAGEEEFKATIGGSHCGVPPARRWMPIARNWNMVQLSPKNFMFLGSDSRRNHSSCAACSLACKSAIAARCLAFFASAAGAS